MWAQVERDLEKMMAAKIYTGLLHDAVYRKFLSFAGFGPSFFPTDLKNVSPRLAGTSSLQVWHACRRNWQSPRS